MLALANGSDFRDLPPNKIVPLLADRGIYVASESSFYRVLSAARQLAHRGRSRPNRYHTTGQPLTATKRNTVWTWDITYLRTQVQGIYYYLYLHVDLYSRRIMGARVHAEESAANAAQLLRELTHKYAVPARTLHLHSDNGAAMKGSTMLVTLQNLGVMPSFSRPGVSDDNPFSESLFKTLKYHPSYPDRPFHSVADAQAWVDRFATWYNTCHLHSALRYVTPQMRYDGHDRALLAHRSEVYAQARARNPVRWKGPTRCWEPIAGTVLLARKDFWKKIG
jgi:putative transposase